MKSKIIEHTRGMTINQRIEIHNATEQNSHFLDRTQSPITDHLIQMHPVSFNLFTAYNFLHFELVVNEILSGINGFRINFWL